MLWALFFFLFFFDSFPLASTLILAYVTELDLGRSYTPRCLRVAFFFSLSFIKATTRAVLCFNSYARDYYKV